MGCAVVLQEGDEREVVVPGDLEVAMRGDVGPGTRNLGLIQKRAVSTGPVLVEATRSNSCCSCSTAAQTTGKLPKLMGCGSPRRLSMAPVCC